MKKIITVLLIISCLVSCDETTLDTNFTPEGELTKIEVITSDNQGSNVDPDVGLEIPKFTLINTNVTFKSTTDPSLIESSLWLIPQPDARPSTGDATLLNVTEFTENEPVVQFLRGNETNDNVEANGFFVSLIETLKDGTINRAGVQIVVREGLNPAIVSAPATRNVPTSIQLPPLGVLGLATTDTNTSFVWKIVDDGFFIDPSGAQVTELIVNNAVPDLNSVPVVFTATDERSEISLQIIRNAPVPTTSEVVVFPITVLPGLVPNGGAFKDNVKLNSEGNQIRILYEDVEFDNASIIQPSDYTVDVNTSGTGITLQSTTVTNVATTMVDVVDDTGAPVLDDNGVQKKATEVTLTLSQKIPPLFMDNVTLSFSNINVLSTENIPIANFEGTRSLAVAETGENIMPSASFDFEDGMFWNGGGFFFPNPPNTSEISFSSEQAYTGTQSLLFETVGTNLSTLPTNFGIGASVITTDSPMLTNGTEYTFSMMVYVESTSPGASVASFLLDFASFPQGAELNALPTGQWVVISGTRVVGADNRILIRVVANDGTTGNVKVFVDHYDVRVADDGK